jgi:hypothetical protein
MSVVDNKSMLLSQVHRLVIVDDDNKVCGVISLSDILNHLVLRPGGRDEDAGSFGTNWRIANGFSRRVDSLNQCFETCFHISIRPSQLHTYIFFVHHLN